MIYYLYTETGVTEVRPLETFGRWQRSLCTEMDIHHIVIRAYILVEYVEPPLSVRAVDMWHDFTRGAGTGRPPGDEIKGLWR